METLVVYRSEVNINYKAGALKLYRLLLMILTE